MSDGTLRERGLARFEHLPRYLGGVLVETLYVLALMLIPLVAAFIAMAVLR